MSNKLYTTATATRRRVVMIKLNKNIGTLVDTKPVGTW